MEREELLDNIWRKQDEAYDLMAEYDSLPHHYGNNVLYQAEAYVVNRIGDNPDITTTELAVQLNKTNSACSQIVKKLIGKGLVVQSRNMTNRRLYNLRLTPDGEQLYEDHLAFNRACQLNTYRMLEEFSDEELEIYLRVQQRINEAYGEDVYRCREHYGKE